MPEYEIYDTLLTRIPIHTCIYIYIYIYIHITCVLGILITGLLGLHYYGGFWDLWGLYLLIFLEFTNQLGE